MKVSILIFLLVSATVFAQERHHFFDYFAVEEMILGEWELEKTIMVDRDSVHYELLTTSKKSLRIDEKSVTVFRDSVKFKRYWKLTENFFYRLSYNVESKSCLVFLYDEEIKKKRKKQRSWASYVIEKCDFNQLVLYQIEHSPLSESEFSNYVYYIYKRKQTNKFRFDDFAGTWHLFCEKGFTFESNHEIIKLNREIDTMAISKLGYQTEWLFNFQGLRNCVLTRTNVNPFEIKTPNKHWVFSDAGNYEIIDAVYIAQNKEWNKLNFWIDFKNQLIYLLHESISVYHFDFDEEGALILSFDESLTKSLKKIER